jgi:hypothetical protein
VIQNLLAENGAAALPATLVKADATGVQMAPDMSDVSSPETYVGYERAENFANGGGLVADQNHRYSAPAGLALNKWALAGEWNVAPQSAQSVQPGGKISFRFHARDLHLVLGPGAEGKPVRFKVTLDGQAPDAAHGMDTDTGGNGTVTSQRLYQLIRNKDEGDHTFAIQFLDPGVQAFAFTFG